LSLILQTIQKLAKDGDIRISEHGYDKLSNDGLTAREIIDGLSEAVVVEEYPNYPKGS
jgi:alkylhydroperoxidase family enzyme